MTQDRISETVFAVLGENLDYESRPVMGLPGSVLDREVFCALPTLEQFPLLRCFRSNPNHIGIHTTCVGEKAFQGTQRLELELLRLCAEEILGAESQSYDGYVATGGTESNIQALWTFRNYLRSEYGVTPEKIAILCSDDTHYSVHKGADLLGLNLISVPVDTETRRMTRDAVRTRASAARRAGIEHVIAVLNMGTTMFGSIDHPNDLLPILDEVGLTYRCHVDAAFGGFIYPFVEADNPLTFADPRIHSFTLDAHKMLQAPYGTGIHLIRKGYVEHVVTRQATYVPGLDSTLCGSRSGTNAVAVWMILQAYGSDGGVAFCRDLLSRTDRLCDGLCKAGVGYYRHARMNVVALRASDISRELASRYCLVSDSEDQPSWWKIVVMDHVSDEKIASFLSELTEAGVATVLD